MITVTSLPKIISMFQNQKPQKSYKESLLILEQTSEIIFSVDDVRQTTVIGDIKSPCS
jgi:hypothetical protein